VHRTFEKNKTITKTRKKENAKFCEVSRPKVGGLPCGNASQTVKEPDHLPTPAKDEDKRKENVQPFVLSLFRVFVFHFFCSTLFRLGGD